MSAGMQELTGVDFDATVAQGVTLVDFWAPWCGPCKMQTPILEQLVGLLAGRAKVAKVNVDEARDLALKFSVRSIPALMVFKDGKVVKQFTGLTRADQLSAAIEDALK